MLLFVLLEKNLHAARKTSHIWLKVKHFMVLDPKREDLQTVNGVNGKVLALAYGKIKIQSAIKAMHLL